MKSRDSFPFIFSALFLPQGQLRTISAGTASTRQPASLRLRTIVRSFPWAGEAKPVKPLPEWRQKKTEPAEADPDKARSRLGGITPRSLHLFLAAQLILHQNHLNLHLQDV